MNVMELKTELANRLRTLERAAENMQPTLGGLQELSESLQDIECWFTTKVESHEQTIGSTNPAHRAMVTGVVA